LRIEATFDAGRQHVSSTNEEIHKFLEGAIAENEVMLFMKGTPDQPRCGFSMRTSAALNSLGVRYAAMDVLPDPRIREELSAISDWPTIPQLFVNGKLVGGCDIVTEMYETGELADLLGVEQPEDEPEPPSVEPPLQSAPMGLENRLSD
jgi:monothiol glutaredoxin